MIAPILRDTAFMQLCWVVPDIEAGMAAWTKIAGVGPFFLFKDVKYDNPHYRGKPTTCVDITAAIAQAGDVQIELVTQNEERPSVFRDIVPAGKSGFHHAAICSKNYDADVSAYTRAGAPIVFTGLMMGFRVCWIDASATLGFMVEIIEDNPVAQTVFAKIREPSINWDGRDPVRSLG